jgi:cold shock protein
VFVHYSSISGEGFRTLIQGQTVEYDEAQGPKGLFAAKVLKVLEAQPS